ncbi:hypothetical protein SprV_0200909900 [Sparganum proliferum]
MRMNVYRGERPGIRIAFRNDGHLVNSKRIQSPTRLSTTTVHDLLLADDCVLNTTTEVHMQRGMDLLDAGYSNFGLTINTDKTVAMHQQQPNTQHCTPPRIPVDGIQIKTVNIFAYFGSTHSDSTSIDDEVTNRTSKASPTFGRQQNCVESSRPPNEHQTEDVKGRRPYDIPYAAKTWTVYSRHARKLNHSHLSCLYRILNLK